ncbi:MAG: hypothetical protein K6A64_02870 [Bacteroidales bacterium]|nr:hypothetical protein [Bacteroidales bacterium]
MNMKLRNILLLSLVVLGVAAVSCKKDEETESKPSLSGLYFEVTPYLRVGQSITITPTRVTHPEGKGVGYYWQLDSEAKDTVKYENDPATVSISKTYTFTEEDIHAIYCGAFADGYYTTTYSGTVRVVNPALEGMVKGTGISSGEPSVVDNRSGAASENTYYYVHIGSLDWMRNNLAYKDLGVAYKNSEVTSYPLGRYYSWTEAQTACPSGWRLPTMAEWQSLGTVAGDLMADATILGEKFWEFWPQVKITNALTLGVISAGYAMTGGSTNVFKGIGTYAAFWTSDENADNSEQGMYVYIHAEDPAVHYGQADKESVGFSVRCVR